MTKFHYYSRVFEAQDFYDNQGSLPEQFTFATTQRSLPSRESFLILHERGEDQFYIVKIRNKAKVTTFEHRLTCEFAKQIEFSLEDVSKLLSLRMARFGVEGAFVLITNDTGKGRRLINYLVHKNPELKDYFKIKKRVFGRGSDLAVEVNDAFLTGFELFGIYPRGYKNLTEEQIMDWELSNASELVQRTPDGKYYLENAGRKLYVQKVHNTSIERCLGVDLIYHYYKENRLIFIQYKCLNYKNNRFYKSRDKHLAVEVKKMSSFLDPCNNRKVLNQGEVRICDCPFFIKLCSRNIPNHRTRAYGFYFTICLWKKIADDARKPYITLNEEPRISNELFQNLVDARLIGTRTSLTSRIKRRLQALSMDRLTISFTEYSNDSDL